MNEQKYTLTSIGAEYFAGESGMTVTKADMLEIAENGADDFEIYGGNIYLKLRNGDTVLVATS